METVLVSSKEYARDNREYVNEVINKYGVNVVYSDISPMGEDDIIKAVNELNASGLLVYSSSDKVTERVILSCKSLKVISRHGVGLENIDVKCAEAAGIKIRNTKNAHDYEDIADLVFGMILNVAKELYKFNAELKGGVWNRVVRPGVWGKTIGIIGFGRIGRTVARRAYGFRMNIIAYDPFLKAEEIEESYGVKSVDFETILRESDFLSLHCVVTEQTRLLIGEKELKKMKSTAYLINSARAALVDNCALAEALLKGTITGAASDVFDSEPAIDDCLIKCSADRIFVTPHIGIYTSEVLREIDVLAMDNMLSEL